MIDEALVKLVHSTVNAEKVMAYCARVSAEEQNKEEFIKLLKYCIKNKHWSVFEMADMCVEINTSRAIAQQILRHRSFHFQEFSQRYAYVPDDGVVIYTARAQDDKNRQNSIDNLSEDLKNDWEAIQNRLWHDTKKAYNWAVDAGIAKECARMILPVQTKTKMYMKGTIRDWIHYISLRTSNGTQLEHKEIAEAIKEVFISQFPNIAEAAFN